MQPPEAAEMINQAALSTRRDGCILENQEDYEFRRCSFEKTRIRTVDSDGVPLTLKNYKFMPGTKCGIIRCKAQYAGPWTRNMHCKCDSFGCRWSSRLFEDKDAKSVNERTFWEKPKEIQRQDAEPLLSVCHRGCVAVNENKFKVNKNSKKHVCIS